MSKLVSCCKDFPDECKGCPDYIEEINTTLDVALTGWFGFYSGPTYAVKRCTRFNRKAYGRIQEIKREQ
ncbi:MAG: hypothetical protein ABSF82_14890 [Candidatus Bathyarchaeia archaeon]|jgi:hypothetical protein